MSMPSACSQCGCNHFVPNLFKKNMCSECYHDNSKHSSHGSDVSSRSDVAPSPSSSPLPSPARIVPSKNSAVKKSTETGVTSPKPLNPVSPPKNTAHAKPTAGPEPARTELHTHSQSCTHAQSHTAQENKVILQISPQEQEFRDFLKMIYVDLANRLLTACTKVYHEAWLELSHTVHTNSVSYVLQPSFTCLVKILAFPNRASLLDLWQSAQAPSQYSFLLQQYDELVSQAIEIPLEPSLTLEDLLELVVSAAGETSKHTGHAVELANHHASLLDVQDIFPVMEHAFAVVFRDLTAQSPPQQLLVQLMSNIDQLNAK